MSRLVGVVLAVAGVVAAWTPQAPVVWAQSGPATIEGQVVNGTPGGGSVEGSVVVLHRESPSVHDHLETVVGRMGRFAFRDVEVDGQARYGVAVTYEGGLFGVDLDPTAGEQVTLTVYDAVQGDDVLSVSSASLLFAQTEVSSQSLVALEIVKVVNSSDHAYVPGPQPMDVLRFGLPPGSEGLSVQTPLAGADFIQVDRGFALFATVPPGEHEVLIRYSFPYTSKEVAITKSFRYGAGSLRVLAPEGLLDISSPELGDPETVDIGGRPYRLLQASGLDRGARVSLELTELTVATLSDRVGGRIRETRFEYVAPIALAVFMAIVIAYAIGRRRGRQAP